MRIRNNGKEVTIPNGSASNGDSGSGIPSGGIIIWSGSSDAVPDGWALCNGENGTPDLKGRFVLGENAVYDDEAEKWSGHRMGETGGSEEVTLTTGQMPSHTHSYSAYSVNVSGSTTSKANVGITNGSGGSISSGGIFGAGSSQPHPNMPPYYVLCYIMKL